MTVQRSDPNCKGVRSTRLPPGYRFHPTDQELVSFYLVKKREKNNDVCGVVGEVDFNNCEPWDLPEKAKARDESSFYFYSCKDRKYPTGLRTNRATKVGYWKATGRDRQIVSKGVVGMKKTLVFYKGRAPKGEKTDWIMHEYRLDGELKAHQQDWVISRVFEKRPSSRKKVLSESTPNSTHNTGYNLDHSSGQYQNRHHPSMILQAPEFQPSSSYVKPNYTNIGSDTSEERWFHEAPFPGHGKIFVPSMKGTGDVSSRNSLEHFVSNGNKSSFDCVLSPDNLNFETILN